MEIESGFSELSLEDLPNRLEAEKLAELFKKIWSQAKDGARVSMRVQQPILPETVHALCHELDLPYENAEVALELYPHWQDRVDAGEIQPEEVPFLAIEWINIELTVKKSEWRKGEAPVLTPDMRKQLQEQIQLQESRGNFAAAETIRKVLK